MKKLIGLGVIVALLFGGGMLMTGTAAAAGPVIGAGSCGGTPVPNNYCSFDGTGENVVIGPGSCNVLFSCTSLGDGTTIGEGSCNGDEACEFSGAESGSASIGDGSCNAVVACYENGDNGSGTVGDGSCNGSEACDGNGSGFSGGSGGSSGTIGNGSCNGETACLDNGAGGGSGVIGNYACNGDASSGDPCYENGSGGAGVIGDCEYNKVFVAECVTDADGDGVADDADLCPGTAAGDAVDANGCADVQVDGDGDGFCDPGALSTGPAGCTGTDQCPSEDSTGLDADANGCIDSINDIGQVVQTLVDSGAIDQVMQNSLMSKIDAATASSTAENICAAVNQLDALANQVEAQTGKKISAEASALLLSYIANVQAGLQSGSGVTCE